MNDCKARGLVHVSRLRSVRAHWHPTAEPSKVALDFYHFFEAGGAAAEVEPALPAAGPAAGPEMRGGAAGRASCCPHTWERGVGRGWELRAPQL